MKCRFIGTMKAAGVCAFLFGVLFSSPALAQCPSEETVVQGFRKMFGREMKVIKIQRSAMPFLCEAHVSVGGRNDVLYTDSEGSYLVRGPLYDVRKGVNLSEQVITQLNRLSTEEMKQVESLVAFTVGTSSKVVYFVTDPQCPYCKRGLTILRSLIDEGKLTVKFVLYPLPMHKGADEQCVALICDNKSLDALESEYRSENQCPEGREKVDKALAFFKGKGIAGTPAYIFDDGTYQVGVMQREALLEK